MKTLTWLELFVLRHIFKRVIVQGFTHCENVTQIYSLVREAAVEEFTEDTPQTMNQFLQERFSLTQA